MSPFIRCLVVALLICLCATESRSQSLELPGDPSQSLRPPKAATDAEATLVVYNEADPNSAPLARYYAEKRGVPPQQVIGVNSPVTEEISRAEYDSTIAEPLRRAMTSNFWWKLREPDSPLGPVEWNRIRYVVLMRGVPLKIRFSVAHPDDKRSGPSQISQHNEASVDSELAVLALRSSIAGAINNPYFRSYSRIGDANRPDLMLVCRLDAPSPEIVRRMIDDSISTEQKGLSGFAYIDARGLASSDPGLKEGDDWLMKASAVARKKGIPVILDNGPALFPDGYPMRHAALYLGWYQEHVSGTFTQRGFKFRPGAIAVHIHSFSAVTVRESGKQWVGPLLEAGAAATLGNVYEPYLTLTPHLDVFFERLAAGFTFAESAYMSQRGLSWMTTFIGDPLYRPFPMNEIGEKPARTEGEEWAAYAEGAETWFRKGAQAGAKALQQSGRKLRSGPIFEALGLLLLTQNTPKDALIAFEEARRLYKDPDDEMRAAIHETILLRGIGRGAEALALAKNQIRNYPNAPAVSVFHLLFPELAPPPPPTTAPAQR